MPRMRNMLIILSGIWLLGENAVLAESRTNDAEKVAETKPDTSPLAISPDEDGNVNFMMADHREVTSPGWFQQRATAQKKALAATKVFHDFTIADRALESGITFRNWITPDGGKNFRPAHYDHGNGVTIADVDGDGLYDIYFTSYIGGNELWRNLGGGKFENITKKAKVACKGRINVTASFADIDNDGDPDLYVTTVRDGNVLFENNGSGKFKDISKSSGLDYNGHCSAALFFDYDNDGLLDLFLVNIGKFTTNIKKSAMTNYPDEKFDTEYFYYLAVVDAFEAQQKPEHNEHSILYRNTGKNRFVDVTKEVGLIDNSWSGDATSLDLNEDGWQDLYIVNMQGDDQYYENVEGKRFVNKTSEVFPLNPWGAMGVKAFDYNNDGRMDIYVTDMHTDMNHEFTPYDEKKKYRVVFGNNPKGKHIYGNAFYRNEGNGKFKEISDDIGVENLWPWGLSVGDLNADGFQDIFVTASMNMIFRYGANSVFLNDHGWKFVDSEFVLGVEPRRDRKTAKPWYRLYCDGADKTHAVCRQKKGRVDIWEALGSRSSVIFDLDNDGDLDIVCNEWNWHPMVLISDLSDAKKIAYLKVRLTGKKSNRDGLGARVTVSAAGESYTQVFDGTSGYLSHSLYPLYFGLGDITEVDKVEVLWPSGEKQTVSAPIKINSLLEITEKVM
jgi:hypothetical protein